MSIRSIDSNEFYSHDPAVSPMTKMFADEREWFADSKSNILGALILDKSDRDWNYVIMGRDEHGKFRWIDGKASIETQEAAREALKEAMKKIEQSGEAVFPQGD